MEKEILRFENVSFSYQTPKCEITALKNLSFSVHEGEFVSVIGPSGCGKSTLLSLASGLLSPSSGKIERRGKVGYMLQRDELFPWRTVEKNLFLPLELTKKMDKNDRKKAEERTRELARKYGLKDFLRSYPTQLSGGMRQRAALIRTLSGDPDLLLLDEPFSALDYQTRLSVTSDVSSILKKERKTALLITHDISEAISLSDRIIVLTCRPATLKSAHSMDFSSHDPLKRREDHRFSVWFETLWKELNG